MIDVCELKSKACQCDVYSYCLCALVVAWRQTGTARQCISSWAKAQFSLHLREKLKSPQLKSKHSMAQNNITSDYQYSCIFRICLWT